MVAFDRLRMTAALRLLVVLHAFAGLPAWAQSFTFDAPKGWSLKWSPDQSNMLAAPDANFSSDLDQIVASVSLLHGQDASELNAEQLKDIILTMAEDSLPQSREGTADVKRFGTSRDGMYLRLTDKDRQAAFKYLTFAIHRKGRKLALGLMTSNDDDGAMQSKFLHLVESVEPVPALAGLSGKPVGRLKTKGKVAGAGDGFWGAIATDATQGDNDPWYSIGNGSTQAEAAQEAVGLCRDEGAQACVVRVAYKRCGAYAVSVSGLDSGAGMGSTRKAAEKHALRACKGRGCEVIASDCN